MLTITLGQLRSDITPKLKGTSIRQISDFYGTAANSSNRMLSRIDPEETRRVATLANPFWSNVQSYVMATDYKRMIDIRPQANRTSQPGLSHFDQTTARQFNETLTPDSYSIGWNNMVRTLRAQCLPESPVAMLDPFDSASSNGLWTAEGDASGLYSEPLNYIEGNGSLGMDLSGSTGLADIVNSTAAAVDLSAQLWQDASMLYVYIPVGFSSRFTNFKLRRGSSALNYREATATTKADGTAFSDGWNFLLFYWNSATVVGSPDNTLNTYRRFGITYSVGAAISGFLIDDWVDSLGKLYEMEYYSEYMFRTSAGAWIQTPTSDSDLVNVGPNSYEILKTEMMVDITQEIRIGAVRDRELADWRRMLDGQPQSRYVKNPADLGLYENYLRQFPSSAIATVTRNYTFDV